MLYAVRGILALKSSTKAVVDSNGLMFEMAIPLSTYTRLPDVGDECLLYVELVIGEKLVKLYGFATEEEKNLFNELRKVSKIGPQTALSVLSRLSVEQFYRAVAERDEATIRSVPGIGKNTALSVILEFSSKLPTKDGFAGVSVVNDAREALISMGFSAGQVNALVESLYRENPEISLENLIKEALKRVKNAR